MVTFARAMQGLVYTITYPMLWLVAWLPMRGLLLLGDVLYPLVYHVARYRRGVVRENLQRSFPEKTPEELGAIERDFYRHFCDSFFEWIYPLHRSARQLSSRYRFVNAELLNELHTRGRSVVGVTGHYGNWEFLSLLPVQARHKIWAIHLPLMNRNFDRLINGLRSKYGVHMMTAAESFKVLHREIARGEVTMTYFLSDQSPHRDKVRYWTRFLNQDTPVFLGAEQVARKLDMAVVFMHIAKCGRGRYEVHFELLTDAPKSCEPFEITELHVRALERRIREQPAYWLWSHRRWKHTRGEQ